MTPRLPMLFLLALAFCIASCATRSGDMTDSDAIAVAGAVQHIQPAQP